jgi:hypothetical protein
VDVAIFGASFVVEVPDSVFVDVGVELAIGVGAGMFSVELVLTIPGLFVGRMSGLLALKITYAAAPITIAKTNPTIRPKPIAPRRVFETIFI